MKRVLRISDAAAAESELLSNLHRYHPKPVSLIPNSFTLQRPSLYRFYGDTVYPTTSLSMLPNKKPDKIIDLFIEKLSQAESELRPKSDTVQKVIQLRDELVKKVESLEEVVGILEERGDWLLGNYVNQDDVPVRTKEIPDRVFSELLTNMGSWPNLAMELWCCGELGPPRPLRCGHNLILREGVCYGAPL